MELNLQVMYIFPGQGAQYKGMGKDIYTKFDIARRIYDTASNIVGYDIAELSFSDR
jgi:[acyl-carrier-protein] S-malonyltransferase